MRIEEHIAQIRSEGDRLVDLLSVADLQRTVPTCPEWTIAELGRHLGRVHRWAATSVRTACDHAPSDQEREAWWGPAPNDDDLVTWVAQGVDGIVGALSAAPPDLQCWTFLPAPSPLAFWARRQAHETTIHRVDGEVAVRGTSGPPIPVDLAVDGVDELLLAFYSRPNNRLRSADPLTLTIRASDADAAWLVRFTADGAQCERAAPTAAASADAAIVAPASSLYIGLWNRGELDVTGDPAAVELWRGKARIRWT